MSGSKLLCYPFCNPEMIKNLEKTRIMEIAPEIFFVEGYTGPGGFFVAPPSGNIFILRDGDLVLLVDTGHHPFFREKILGVLDKLKKDGARELVLMMSHGHIDHGKNNDVIYEAGYESTRFLLPEPEFHTINIPAHAVGSHQKAMDYYDSLENTAAGLKMVVEWCKQFPEYHDPKYQRAWEAIMSQPEEYDADKTMEAFRALFFDVISPDLSSYNADRAETLTLESRETRIIGDVEFKGWPVGRFFAIHDATQSPGHISFYDPQNKLMITGDATLEINPPCMDCDYGACIDLCRKCLSLTEQGHILLATDGHRSSQFWPATLTAWNLEVPPAHSFDVATGREECLTFYQFWFDYFTALRDEALAAHSRIGQATVKEIAEEFRKSNNKYVKFKLGLSVSGIPTTLEMLVARLLLEGGAERQVEGNRILFSPPETWKSPPF